MKKKKCKNYMVLVTGYCKVLVLNAENEEKAMEYATDQMSMGDFQLNEAEVECSISKDLVSNARVEADYVAEDL